MTLSLDTNVLIDIANDARGVRARFKAAQATGEEMVVSVIALGELRFGADLSLRPPQRHADIDSLMAPLTIAPLTEADVVAAASLRATLERQGRRIGGMDALIAGQAVARGWTVVTDNTSEFSRVSGLALQNWRS